MAHSSRGKKVLTNAKPFCECKQCNNKQCPNVLHKLGVTLKDSMNEKKEKRNGPKWGAKPKKDDNNPDPNRTSSLLGILNSGRDCSCDVVAKALRSDVHTNLGTLLKRRRSDDEPPPDITPPPSNDPENPQT